MKRNYYEKMSGILETMTIDEVKRFQPEVVLIPVGSTEPHGPHLPYGTDTFTAKSMSIEATQLANAEGGRVLCLPCLPISNNVNFKGFPFSCRLGVETLMAILLDLVTALAEDGIHKIVILNGHGGNTDTIRAALRQIYDRFQQSVFVCSCGTFDFANTECHSIFADQSPHAGDAETSLALHLVPDLVQHSAFKPSPLVKSDLSCLENGRVTWVRAWHRFLPESYGGNPEFSTKEKGGKFFEENVRGCGAFLKELSRAPWHDKFPFPKN